MVKKRAKQRLKSRKRCPYTGLPQARVAKILPEELLTDQGRVDEQRLREKYPDCDLFNIQEIAWRAGFSQAQYFLDRAEVSSCWHMHRFEAGFATATNSADTGKVNYEQWKQPSREAARARTPGWHKCNWDVSSGDLLP